MDVYGFLFWGVLSGSFDHFNYSNLNIHLKIIKQLLIYMFKNHTVLREYKNLTLSLGLVKGTFILN